MFRPTASTFFPVPSRLPCQPIPPRDHLTPIHSYRPLRIFSHHHPPCPFQQQRLLYRAASHRPALQATTLSDCHSSLQTNPSRCIALIPCASRARQLPHKFKTLRRHNRLPRPAAFLAAATLVCPDRVYPNYLTGLISAGHNFRKSAAGAFGPDLAKKLNQLVKMEKNCMRTMELVGRERMESAVSLTTL